MSDTQGVVVAFVLLEFIFGRLSWFARFQLS